MRSKSALHMGCGKTTRKNSESCWLGRRGKPKILSHSVREVIVSVRRQHSRKPEEFYRRVQQFCGGPRLDLFGRESRTGWVVYGDQATKFDAPAVSASPVLQITPRRAQGDAEEAYEEAYNESGEPSI